MRRCWGQQDIPVICADEANSVRTTTWLSVPLVSGAPKGMAAPMWAALRISSSQGTSSAMLPHTSCRVSVQVRKTSRETWAKETGDGRCQLPFTDMVGALRQDNAKSKLLVHAFRPRALKKRDYAGA